MVGPQKPLLQSTNSRRAGSPGSRHVSPLPTTSARMPLQSVVSRAGEGGAASALRAGAAGAADAGAPEDDTAPAPVAGWQPKPNSHSFSVASRELRFSVKSHLGEPGMLVPTSYFGLLLAFTMAVAALPAVSVTA